MDKLDARSIKAIVSALFAVLTYSLSGGSIDPIYAILGGVAAMTLMSIHEIVDAIHRIMVTGEVSLSEIKELAKAIEAIKANQTVIIDNMAILTSDVKEQEMKLLSPQELERVLTEKLSDFKTKEDSKNTEKKEEQPPKATKSKFNLGDLKGSANKK